jgi:hypothetical protein
VYILRLGLVAWEIGVGRRIAVCWARRVKSDFVLLLLTVENGGA